MANARQIDYSLINYPCPAEWYASSRTDLKTIINNKIRIYNALKDFAPQTGFALFLYNIS